MRGVAIDLIVTKCIIICEGRGYMATTLHVCGGDAPPPNKYVGLIHLNAYPFIFCRCSQQ
jgi:hypothetical protein